jgi:hypothetical protein
MVATVIVECVALFILLAVAFAMLLSDRSWKREHATTTCLDEATFEALPLNLRSILDEFAIPRSVASGVVSMAVSPDAWLLMRELSEQRMYGSSSVPDLMGMPARIIAGR